MVRRLLRRAGHGWLPITSESLKDVAAALRKHRSLANYLCDWRREHLMAGHTWGEGLQTLRKELIRAATRGQGPPRRAPTFGAENLPNPTPTEEKPLADGGPRWPWLMLAVGVCWLLRGAEIADLLGEQASVDEQAGQATLDLGPTKMDTQGRGCERHLRCLCASGRRGPCPYCSLRALLKARRAAGLGKKDPLFPTRRGRAPKRSAVVKTLVALLKQKASEHTMRREGAQMLARRDVPMWLIQFLGRWGGDTVARYVGEALKDQLAKAASASAAGIPDGDSKAYQRLRRTILDVVKEALDARQEEDQQIEQLRLEVAAAPTELGAPYVQSRQQVQGVRAGRPHGLMHDVLLRDESLPREAWVTRCTWRFGAVEHATFTGAVTTCARCISRRAVEARTT